MNKKILVVDDEELILKSIEALLKKHDWCVDTCSNPLEAINKVLTGKYDCILLDVRMPQLSGPDLLEKIRGLESENKISNQQVIFLTGYSDENAQIKAFQQGAVRYLSKPFDASSFVSNLERCLDAKKVIEDNYPLLDPPDEKGFKQIRKNYDKNSLDKKVDYLASSIGIPLKHIKACSYDSENLRGNIENPFGITQIPLAVVGPVSVKGKNANGEYWVPMATTEGALVLTYDLGARLLSMSGPIEVETVSSVIHISPMFPITDGEDLKIDSFLNQNFDAVKKVAEADSGHLTLLQIDRTKIKDNYVLTFRYDTQDAHGLNMINHATFYACKYIESKLGCRFYHRSHYSGVKHHSPRNEDCGYGRKVVAKGYLTSKALSMLRVTASQMKDFFDRCITCGSAAGIKSVNVHAANALTAMYIATGQDVADISSSHVCETKVELANEGKDLVVQVELKNLLIATVGGGTGLATQRECLSIMRCFGSNHASELAEVMAATVLAGEFPTAAAVINESYVGIHNKYGRNKSKAVF